MGNINIYSRDTIHTNVIGEGGGEKLLEPLKNFSRLISHYASYMTLYIINASAFFQQKITFFNFMRAFIVIHLICCTFSVLSRGA